MLNIPLRAASTALVLLGVLSAGAAAQQGAPAQGAAADPVVARVGDHEIRLSEVNAMRETLPPQYRDMPLERLFPPLLRQMIDTRLIVAAAEAAGVDREPAVAERLAATRRATLRHVYIERIVADAVTDEALQKAYEVLKARTKGESQIRASHILLRTEREAVAVIAELAKPGTDFATVARSRSTGPSAAQGGDLGFFGRSDMVKPFADAAFALDTGQVTDKPVRTQFGWHVIKLVERRPVPVPTFEEAEDDLREEVQQRAVAAFIADLRRRTPVQQFQMDGTPERPSGIRLAPR